ncbi:MAG: sulfite exporter TauE/SafE family protein [Microlunatus sp.]|nr:sulfite exporter TauE/SafE family protein [Microlunatus sp.]MDN5770279.1 sulfite exporter TauE/SafE family protein [Microlunatus sp.]
MSWWELLLVALAGGGAGLINAVVGTGTLITFPTLLALGVPPVLANVSNSVGLAPGSLSAALASRPDLRGQRPRMIRYGLASLLGSIVGALLLLRLPPSAFTAIVPVLIGLGCVLVIIGPWLTRAIASRRERLGLGEGSTTGPPWLFPVIIFTGAYGGYFGAAQGVLVLAVMGIAVSETMARINGLKNVLVMIANAVAGVVFVIISEVDWWIVLALAVGSVLGAQVGARVGRKLPPLVYRAVIVAVGVVAIVTLVG